MITPQTAALFAMFLLLMGLVTVALSTLDRFAKQARASGGKPNLTRPLLLEVFGLLLGAFGLTILCILLMMFGWFWILQVPFYLVVGWSFYLQDVTRQVDPDPWAVASGVVCVVLAVLGSHLFLRWLASTASRAWPLKRTLQLLLLLVMMFVVGVAFTGLVQQTGWLIRTPDPLVKDARKLIS